MLYVLHIFLCNGNSIHFCCIKDLVDDEDLSCGWTISNMKYLKLESVLMSSPMRIVSVYCCVSRRTTTITTTTLKIRHVTWEEKSFQTHLTRSSKRFGVKPVSEESLKYTCICCLHSSKNTNNSWQLYQASVWSFHTPTSLPLFLHYVLLPLSCWNWESDNIITKFNFS